MSAGISVAFVKIAELCMARGEHPINKRDGAWATAFTDANGHDWQVAVNGHKDKSVADPHLDGSPIKPFHAVVTFNGWPFAVLTPYGGQMGAGEAANEDAFIAALDAEISAHSLPSAVNESESAVRGPEGRA